MISTRDLSKLPDIDGLRRLLQSLAMLDAVRRPIGGFRYYLFSSKWKPGEQMAYMLNGQGDEFFAHFTEAGCWFTGFDHASPMSPYREDPPKPWPGILDSVPTVFANIVKEPAFSVAETTTFCIWRQVDDTEWQVGDIEYPKKHKDPDGSKWMLAILDGRPASYRKHASSMSSLEPSIAAIRHIYDHKPLTPEVVEELNPEVTLQSLKNDIAEIGYPT